MLHKSGIPKYEFFVQIAQEKSVKRKYIKELAAFGIENAAPMILGVIARRFLKGCDGVLGYGKNIRGWLFLGTTLNRYFGSFGELLTDLAISFRRNCLAKGTADLLGILVS